MEDTKEQSMMLYAPWSHRLVAVLVGICAFVLGITFPLLTPSLAGWRYFALALVLGFLFIITGVWALNQAWYFSHHPTLLISAEGICRQEPFNHIQIKWEEIDSIYRINAGKGGVFAVDLSPAGLITVFARRGERIPQRMNISEPQMAFGLPAVNLPLPVDEVLAQIRERFAAQLERYQIDVNDRRGESQADQ